MDRDAIAVGCGKNRFMQRAVAANEFYRCRKDVSDAVMVTKVSVESKDKRKEKQICCWLGKALCFIRISDESGTDKPC